MNLKRIYTKTMVESIKNSGMWLKDAKLLADKGSKEHSRALLIFAGEELGKAFYCWLVINGVYPFNHPDVDFRKKRRGNIFRSHALKNASVFGIMMGILAPDAIPDDDLNPKVEDPFSGEEVELRIVLAKMGAFAAWARSKWMYVDVKINRQGKIQISSPLSQPTESLDAGLQDLEMTVKIFKKLVREMPYDEEMTRFLGTLRDYLRANDPRFPKNPEWE